MNHLFIATIGVIFILLTFIWLILYLLSSDFMLPRLKKNQLNKFNKILVIFPHPDDEALSVSGLMSKFVKMGKHVEWVILTKGERGNDNGELDESLKEIRSAEALAAAEIMNVAKLEHFDMGDGEMCDKIPEVQAKVTQLIESKKPDLIITFDRSGMYGHKDHICTSKSVTQAVKQGDHKVELWYIGLPEKVYSKISLPEHMAENEKFKRLRSAPEFRV